VTSTVSRLGSDRNEFSLRQRGNAAKAAEMMDVTFSASRMLRLLDIGGKLLVLALVICIIIGIIIVPDRIPGKPTQPNYSCLKLGMTPEDTQRLMGEPARRWRSRNHEGRTGFTWQSPHRVYEVEFEKGVVVSTWSEAIHEPG
jgi:hypothetical protein